MNCQNERFIIRPAHPEDSIEILEILEIIEEEDFKGRISLLYTRRPDAYESLMKEGEEVIIVVCQDTVNNKIAGFGSCAIRELFVNGKPEKVGYLFGLRSKKEYRKTFLVLAKAYQALSAALKDKGVNYFFTTILEDNLYAQKLFEKQRKFMPCYEPFGSYEVYTLKTHNKAVKNIGIEFRKANKTDIPSIDEFLSEQGRKFQFYPVISENTLGGFTFPELTYEHFYILVDRSDKILAVGAAWEQQSYKQYIVQGYGGIIKYIYPISSLFPLIGYPSLPKPGSVLNFFTLSFWAVKDSNPELFRTFLQNIAAADINGYPFFLVGIHHQNPLREVLIKMPHLKYSSKIYLVNWGKINPVAESIDSNIIPYFECGSL
jgi:hypothetical protein